MGPKNVSRSFPGFAKMPMTRFRCLLCIGSLSLAATLATDGQAQTPATVAKFPTEKTMESWLLSGDPRLVAWGAHDALLARDQYLIPDLLSLASRWQTLSRLTPDASNHAPLSPEQMDERDAMAVVLDALIQMKVPVPADTLRILAPDFGNEVAVFLSRMPTEEAGPLSFDLYLLPAEHSYGLQYVGAALSALRPVPGFAAHLFANVTVHANVFVVAPESRELFGEGHGGSCGVSSDENPRRDWPVIRQYIFSKQKSDGAFLLLGGIDPIYARRRQSTHYLEYICEIPVVHLGPEERRRLIAEMLSVSPKAIPWQTDIATTIKFQSLPHFEVALLGFIEEQQRMYRATEAELMAHDLLTSAEAEQSLPQLELKLNDMRGADADPILDPSSLPSHVKSSSSPFN